MSTTDEPAPPQAFVSYSWDSEEHQRWVLQLATRLRGDGGGVDVVLDRWDTQLGSDLSLYMEKAGDTAYRVIAIVTARYAEKADAAEGGVGYERRVITPTLMQDLHGHRVIPVLRNNPEGRLPRYLGAAKYVDFRNDERYEDAYLELLMELHGMEATPKPPVGRNPFDALPAEEIPGALRDDPARYVMPSLEGEISFNHSNNNGHYVIGAGDRAFTLNFGSAGHGAVYIYNDPADIKSVALAPGVRSPGDVGVASSYDASSRVRMIQAGNAAIVRNQHDYWAAVFVDEVLTTGTSPTGEPRVRFRYSIPAVPSPDFDRAPDFVEIFEKGLE